MKLKFARFLLWLKTVVPTVTAVGAVIYSWMMYRLGKAKQRIRTVELEKEYVENELAVERDNAGKSDADIVGDLISEGRLIEGDKGDSSGSGDTGE